MSKRAAFFDIDGTLWDYEQKIPDSLKTAIEKLKAAGNYGFICTGRTRSTVYDEKLLSIGFDGILAGCGTHIEKDGKMLLEQYIPYEELVSLRDAIKGAGIGIFMEGAEKLYIDWDYFAGQAYAESFRKNMGEACVGLDTLDENAKVNKLSVDFLGKEESELIDLIDADKYDLIMHDMSNQGDEKRHVAEIVPKGYSKATGIAWVCEHLGIDPSHTYAFGDGSNDIEMLKYAAVGIAMGNGNDIAKETADVVCESVMDDGIFKELRRQGLFIRL